MLSLGGVDALAGNVAHLSGTPMLLQQESNGQGQEFCYIFFITFHFAFSLNPVMCLQNTYSP